MRWYWLTRRSVGRITVLLLGREGRRLLASSVHRVGPCGHAHVTPPLFRLDKTDVIDVLPLDHALHVKFNLSARLGYDTRPMTHGYSLVTLSFCKLLICNDKNRVVRIAGLEPALFGRNQTDNLLKQNDNFRRNHPSHGNCGLSVRAGRWGSQEISKGLLSGRRIK
jgi:hypothetical protein